MTGPMPAAPAEPTRAWYVVHVLIGVISGIIVYAMYRKDNPAAARTHLIVSIVLTFAMFVMGYVVMAGILLAAPAVYY